MTDYTRRVAEFAATLQLSDIPHHVIARAKKIILDGFACAFYGSDVKWTKILAGVVRRMEPQGGQATIWGRNESASAVNAALVNGTMVQGYELDDGNPAGSIHSSAILLPSALG